MGYQFMKERRILGVTLVMLAFHKKMDGTHIWYQFFEFECTVCDAIFAQKTNLSGHMASIKEGKKPFKCNNCDASFTTKQFQEKNK